MKISLLITTFNSISQAYYVRLKDMGYKIDVVYAINDKQMIEEIEQFKPDMIFCPFLKKYIPKEIFLNYPTFVLHPGIIGDRGAYAIDNAIREGKKKWGVVLLRANEEFDGGDVVASEEFILRDSYKASIYRNETFFASLKILQHFLSAHDRAIKQPKTNLHEQLTQKNRAINWQKDTTKEIIKKIYFSDSHPGVKDEILGVECYLFGVWEEEKLKGKPKEILAKRDGAICLATVDGAVWISHLMEPKRFKLPATYVLKERLKGIKEHRLPLIFDKSYKTFYEISCDIDEDVGYLYFNFQNGAFRAEQCIRLKYAIEYLKEKVKVLVLMGGEDFFSNGINLNILEDSKKNGEDGWSNINAINDLVKSVIFAEDVMTVASLHKNAGAGGVFLATACDFVVGAKGRVLNPHYKTLSLSGSEYHTYTLPKRVGEKVAKELLDECLPISVEKAKKIGLVDKVFDIDCYHDSLKKFCKDLIENDDFDEFIWQKEEFLEQNYDIIEQKREQEIAKMYPEFWDKSSEFHQKRKEFVYKICPMQTPKRLKYKG